MLILLLQVGDTRFSVCVVLADDAETFTDIWKTPRLPKSFVYHRLDLRPQPHQCSYLHRVALQGRTRSDAMGLASQIEILKLAEAKILF